jgi:RNA polymerase sigma factor (sigma-70 family)
MTTTIQSGVHKGWRFPHNGVVSVAESQASSTVDDDGFSAALATLTKRELEVLRLRAEGLTMPEIADRCFVSSGTVKGHLDEAYRKLGIESLGRKSDRACYLLGRHDGSVGPGEDR